MRAATRAGTARGGHPLPVSQIKAIALAENAAIVDALVRRDGQTARQLIHAYLLRTLLTATDS